MAESSVSATRSLDVVARYLHLPVRNDAPLRQMTLRVDDVVRSFDIELAPGEPDWWAFVDLSSFEGRTVVVELAGAGADDDAALQAIHQSDELAGAEPLYREARRPQLRFSSRRGWLNDPNGLVYFDGEYHLFYQHNPYGVRGRDVHWGHAVSPDLVHWEELPIALYPDHLGTMASGGAVVDWNNTGGFQHGATPALVAFYTATNQPFTQCVASSNDRGRTWQKFSGNPVIPSPEVWSRDPKVIWHAPSSRWVMALYLDRVDPATYEDESILDVMHEINSYGIYTSRDLKQWEKRSEYVIPGDEECPELFELPIADRPGESRWITFGALGYYLIGDFDGATFTPESGPHVLSEGDCFYAAQTFSDIPVADGRRILIPWARSWTGLPVQSPLFAEMPFNQSMGLPIELTLRSTADGLRLFANPVRELASLRTSTTRFAGHPLRPGDDPLAGLSGELWEIDADISVGDAARLVVEVRGLRISYDVEREEISCQETTAALRIVDGRIRLRIFVDRCAVDVFGGDGRLYMPMGVDLSGGDLALSLRAEGGDAVVQTLEVHELASAWT